MRTADMTDVQKQQYMDYVATLPEEVERKHYISMLNAGYAMWWPEAPKAPIPAFVRRTGEAAPQHDWAPIKSIKTATTTVQAPASKPAVAAAPKVPKLVHGEQGIGRAGTTAEQVRAMIREAMAKDLTVETVIERCKTELGFADSKAKRYATENWERVKKAGK